MPSIIAIAIFVYGFIGWSLRVSVSDWPQDSRRAMALSGWSITPRCSRTGAL
jgi:hypothetical protein